MSSSDRTLTDPNAACEAPEEPLTTWAGRFEIVGELGRGGMGRVFRAIDRQLGREVAIKELLRLTPALRERFVREAQVAARLQHPSIVPVYEIGENESGTPFYAMRLVSDETLRERIAASPALEERLSLLPNLLAVADAMAYAHGKGVIHRDLKPANVVTGPFGDTLIVDWGLAKLVRSSAPQDGAEPPQAATAPSSEGHEMADVAQGLTRTGAVMGTPAYMPPEQARGELVDSRADVYALGAMLYQLLTGTAPYGDSNNALASVIAGSPKSPRVLEPGAPRDLVAIVDKAMARETAQRYPDASGFAEDLRRFQSGQLVGAREYSPLAVAWRNIIRHRVVAAAALLFVIAGAVGLTLWIDRERAVVRQERELRAEADIERDKAQREAAAATLGRAKAVLETDPTEAVVILKGMANAGDSLDARLVATRAQNLGLASDVTQLASLPRRLEYVEDAQALVLVGVDRAWLPFAGSFGKAERIPSAPPGFKPDVATVDGWLVANADQLRDDGKGRGLIVIHDGESTERTLAPIPAPKGRLFIGGARERVASHLGSFAVGREDGTLAFFETIEAQPKFFHVAQDVSPPFQAPKDMPQGQSLEYLWLEKTRQLVVSQAESGEVFVTDLRSGESRKVLVKAAGSNHESRAGSVAFGSSPQAWAIARFSQVDFFTGGTPTQFVRENNFAHQVVSWSNGPSIGGYAIAWTDGVVTMHDETGRLLRKSTGHGQGLCSHVQTTCLAAVDGQLWVGGGDGAVRIIALPHPNTSDGAQDKDSASKVLRELLGHRQRIESLVSAGDFIVSLSGDGQLRAWKAADVNSGKIDSFQPVSLPRGGDKECSRIDGLATNRTRTRWAALGTPAPTSQPAQATSACILIGSKWKSFGLADSLGAVSEDGSTVAFIGRYGRSALIVRGLPSGDSPPEDEPTTVEWTLTEPKMWNMGMTSVSLSADGGTLFGVSYGNTIEVSLDSGVETFRQAPSHFVEAPLFVGRDATVATTVGGRGISVLHHGAPTAESLDFDQLFVPARGLIVRRPWAATVAATGQILATRTDEKTVRVIPAEGPVISMDLHPTLPLLVAVLGRAKIQVWNLETGFSVTLQTAGASGSAVSVAHQVRWDLSRPGLFRFEKTATDFESFPMTLLLGEPPNESFEADLNALTSAQLDDVAGQVQPRALDVKPGRGSFFDMQ